MRILFLTKQQYMGKDLLRDRFGRFYEVPKTLAAQGHQVLAICLKYRADDCCLPEQGCALEGVEWRSFQLGWNWPVGFWRHFRQLNKIAAEFAPDIVVGASDTAHVVMADALSRAFDLPLLLDLYDDFECYGATRLPGMKAGLKRAIRQATAVSAVSGNLAAKVEREYQARGIVRTITNAVCPEIFHPVDKIAARRKLGLAESGIFIGTAGALTSTRGIDVLINAFERMSGGNASFSLILVGPLGSGLQFTPKGRIRYLGELPQAEVGLLFNALDVGIVCNRRDQFAEYCFPQKFYEMIACRLPVVAAKVGVMGALLAGYEDCLYDPGRPESLVDAIDRQLKARRVAELTVPSWRDQGKDFHNLLEQALCRFGTTGRQVAAERDLQRNSMQP